MPREDVEDWVNVDLPNNDGAAPPEGESGGPAGARHTVRLRHQI